MKAVSRLLARRAERMRFDLGVTTKLSFFPGRRAAMLAGAALLVMSAAAQNTPQPTTPTTIPPAVNTQTNGNGSTTTTTTGVDSNGKPTASVSTTFTRGKKKSAKDDKVVQSKATRKDIAKEKKMDVLVGQDARLPDKQLYDKAEIALKKGHFDVARLDLQTMLNTYPDSQYQMRAKLAIADSWYKEGGTAALTQAESEYADFRVFFPNVPEAAEAQMRIGDIYFRQMDKPDRDYAKALHSEEEYRRMLTDYPDSSLVPQAKQRLREVQEVLASREADIASYYATRENWAAVIARDRTVLDAYPLYSHLDDVLISLGDAYAAESRYLRAAKLPEGPKAKLEQIYDGQAAAMYREVVLEHSAAPHVEDARDRLAAMGLPIPTPTKEQVAASEALENSRATYKLTDRAQILFMHSPDVVTAARMGDPTMTTPKPVVAPSIVKQVNKDFTTAFNVAPGAPSTAAPSAAATTAATAPETTAPAPAAAPTTAAPLAFEEVPTADAGAPSSATSTFSTAAPASRPVSSGNGINVEIITHNTPVNTAPNSTADDTPGGLTAAGPTNSTALPAAEPAAGAPDRPNEITAVTPAAQTPAEKGKNKAPKLDKSDESSSTHKPKKGVKKVLDPL